MIPQEIICPLCGIRLPRHMKSWRSLYRILAVLLQGTMCTRIRKFPKNKNAGGRSTGNQEKLLAFRHPWDTEQTRSTTCWNRQYHKGRYTAAAQITLLIWIVQGQVNFICPFSFSEDLWKIIQNILLRTLTELLWGFMKLSHMESSRSNHRLLFIRRSGWVRKIISTWVPVCWNRKHCFNWRRSVPPRAS